MLLFFLPAAILEYLATEVSFVQFLSRVVAWILYEFASSLNLMEFIGRTINADDCCGNSGYLFIAIPCLSWVESSVALIGFDVNHIYRYMFTFQLVCS
jgi:hypothetical protein